ncbi:MAG: DUF86 domain-containing protein [Actinobacteria bacterium]|jgi:uncharacterized protein with HEPN domain|nr:MAG: DUF86 domain-containing protein [Actinomycetota bacterium]
MKDRPYLLFLEDILHSIQKIEEYIGGISFEDLKVDDRTLDAVLRNLEIIGEAAKNVPSEVRQRHPDIPWGRMTGLRNIVSHEYFGIDLSIIWRIVTVNLPETEPLIEDLIKGINQD